MNLRLGVLRLCGVCPLIVPSVAALSGGSEVDASAPPQPSVLGPLLRVVPTTGKDKLQLWQNLARSRAAEAPCEVSAAIRSTQAYTDAAVALSRDRNGFLQRGPDYPQLRQRWREQTPERLLLFHHYDRRGLLPHSWFEALLALQAAGWQVLVSSSNLDPSVGMALAPAGVQIVGRANIGLCLGAYRDLALLLQSTPAAHRQLQALVLCNDSNLLVQSPDALVAQLERWTSQNAVSRPVLAGLTDSAQRDCYHLQSFLLHANRALLQHPAWLRFWLHYAINGSKDDLINHGEIGLSQALLAAGVEPQPPRLVRFTNGSSCTRAAGLWHRPARKCQSKSVCLAQSFGCGFPLVKKHVLFQLVEHQGQPMAIAELAELIPKERRALLTRDIEQLLISRFSSGVPRMG